MKNKLLNKWTVIALFFTILVGSIGVFVYRESTNRTKIENGLTDMAREYLEEEKKSSSDSWKDVNVEKDITSEETVNQTVRVGTCLSIKIPFAIRNISPAGNCAVTISTSSPSGEIVISVKKASTVEINDVPDVKLRMVQKDTYQQGSKTINDVIYKLFTQKGSQYIESAFSIYRGNLVILSISSPTNDDLSGQFDTLLSSIQFN